MIVEISMKIKTEEKYEGKINKKLTHRNLSCFLFYVRQMDAWRFFLLKFTSKKGRSKMLWSQLKSIGERTFGWFGLERWH